MKRYIFLVVALLCSLISQAQSPTWKDLNYVGDTLVGHQLDIYLPDSVGGPYKVVVLVYGGAWIPDNGKGWMAQAYAQVLLDAGLAVVSVNHRSIERYPFPAHINDVKAAIRYIRGNAEKYHLDTSFIGITGASSGGHISNFMGLTNGVKRVSYEGVTVDIEGDLGAYTAFRSDVDAVVDWCGPTDLVRLSENKKWDPMPEVLAKFADKNNPGYEQRLVLGSPMYYLDRQDVPFLVIHGTEDTLVPYEQSLLLTEQLKEYGLLDRLITIPEGSHSDPLIYSEAWTAMVDFFRWHASRSGGDDASVPQPKKRNP